MDSRAELQLRRILGEEVDVPEPMSRMEELLEQIYQQGGMSGGGGEAGTLVSIQKIEKTGTSGLVDTYTITLTDESTTTYTVRNGANGTNGKDGAPGANGADGEDGEDGFSPTITEHSGNDESTYKLDIATKTGSFTTPNLKGGGSGTGTGTTDYADLDNKPKINEVELTGNKTLSDLSIQSTSDNTLNTTDKTIVGVINELYSMITSISQKIDEVNGEAV